MKLDYVGQKRKMAIADYIIYAVMIILSFIFIYPLVNTLALSLSDAKALVGETIYFLPKGFTMNSYKTLLSDITIFRYYFNTILYATTGTLITLLFTALMAYPLIFKELVGRKFVSILLIITTFFGGGLIPTYLTMKNFNLMDTIWVIILPGAISAWNVIMFRTFFMTIPESLREAAFIDGAGHFRVLFKIIIPLSKPLIATVALFTIVGFWNDYFNALIYLDTSAKMPIQIFLRSMLIEMSPGTNIDMSKVLDVLSVNPRTTKAAATIITIVPILCVYPFMQKYFTKGMMLGSVKA
ncbi:MAG: carbohydrate ABC transporter permease [Oscillospiraceae bacterium]